MIHGCNTHWAREVLPAGCKTCQRIQLEKDIVTRTVHTLLAAGYLLNVDNGGDQYELEDFSAKQDELLPLLMETDEDFLIVGSQDRIEVGWVRFVYGNDGWDVISDYTTNLEMPLLPVNNYVSEIEP